MQVHRTLTAVGAVLLVVTFMVNNSYQQDGSEGFNYAYVTGVAMLAAFMCSFFLFHKNRKLLN